NWQASVVFSYVRLHGKANSAQLDKKITDQYTINYARAVQTNPNIPKGEPFDTPITVVEHAREWLKDNQQMTNIRAQTEPVKDIHLRPAAYPWRDSPANHPVNDYEQGNHIPVTVFSV